MNKYQFLKKYICSGNSNGITSNSFFSVASRNIIGAQKALGFHFPQQLKDFWDEIGYGFFHVSDSGKTQNTHTNRLMSPDQIADILLSNEDDPNSPVLPEFYEYLTPGDMPFFEIGDSVSFLYMRPNSETPNAVYDSLGNEVSSTFEQFVYRLYYESPTFYCESDSWGKIPSNS